MVIRRGALEAFEELEKAGLGELITTKTKRATVSKRAEYEHYFLSLHIFLLLCLEDCVLKGLVPDSVEGKQEFN